MKKTQLSENRFYPVLLAQEDGVHLKVWCPFCVQFHFHGAGGGEGGEGHRVAHCYPESASPFLNTGYIIRKTVPRREADALRLRRMEAAGGTNERHVHQRRSG